MRRFHVDDAPRKRSNSSSEFRWARRVISMPEGHFAAFSRRRSDVDTLLRYFIHSPARRAEQNHVADLRFEHELFVQLAKPALRIVGPREIDSVVSAIGDGSGVGD